MADTKISALTALTGANVTAADDVLAIVDTSVTTTKKITVDEFDNALWAKTAHTIGANYTATRAAGTVAAGTVVLQTHNFTAVGDSGGTTNISGRLSSISISGANNVAISTMDRHEVTFSGSGTATNVYGSRTAITNSGTGTIFNGIGFRAAVTASSSGNITNAYGFYSDAPTLSSTGAVTNFFGGFVLNPASANITNAYGYYVENMTNAVTLMAAFSGQMAAGSGKFNLKMDGTAQNLLNGVTGIGIAASSSAALTLVGSTTSVASLRITHGSAPTSPVNGDVWTTTSGLFIRINGVTKTVTLT